MQIKEWQEVVDQWINTIGVRYFSEMTNLAVLMEEVGEFARIVSRKYGEQSFKKTISKEAVDDKLKEELADIIFVVTCLANQMNIDLETELLKTIEKKTKRDEERHLGNEKLQ